MTEDILINVTPFETRVALVEQGAVQELHIERSIQRGHVGNLYLGKVVRVLPGMQSAFVDIGLERAAFIHVADLRQNRTERSNGSPVTSIEKLLFEGQSLMVQVLKDPLGTKGARLSTQISIAGRMLVYLPYDPHVGISQKIEAEEDRVSLRERVLRFMAKDRIMPHIGFDSVHGLEWFRNKNYLDFPWGKDDRAFFEGALGYVGQLQKQDKPWMLTLLTVGTHQPYSAPAEYLERYDTPKQAAVAYLDDAVGAVLDNLERQGVLKDTLVVLTSDESHGIDGVRLASSWGFNLTLAPEQAQLPTIKRGTYGHIDLATSLLDYFALPIPVALGGRSLYRDYDTGREMISYTNGMLRYHNGQGVFTECDFQQRCRRYASEGFIADQARYLGPGDSLLGQQIGALAGVLDQSLLQTPLNLRYQVGGPSPIKLRKRIHDDWADNLIGAQYLEMPEGSHTRVRVKVRSLDPKRAAYIQLKAKQLEQDVPLGLPQEVKVTADEPLEMEFSFDNPTERKAFSFHLLGYGGGKVEVSDFSVITALPGEDDGADELAEGHIAHSG